MAESIFLHAGPGPLRKGDTPFAELDFKEFRVDLDPSFDPDLLSSITNLENIESESMDAIYSSHNLEHLYAHEVPTALSEFLRVLKSDGFLLLTCPDLQSVAQQIAADKLCDPVYMSTMGPITPLDIVYGHRRELARGNHHMAHRCGFTASVLAGSLKDAGFAQVACQQRGANHFDLWALATKQPWPTSQLQQTVKQFFPG